MKTKIFLKNGYNKKGVETSKLSNDTKKSISNFRETIPLIWDPVFVYPLNPEPGSGAYFGEIILHTVVFKKSFLNCSGFFYKNELLLKHASENS
jgi:hypothetical protein